jgi:hypothetical protein
LGLCPNLNRSDGKDKRSQTRKVQNRAVLAFRTAARSVTESHTALGAFYRRMRARRDAAKALTATARKLAIIFYKMVKFRTPYTTVSEEDYLTQQHARQLKRLRKQATRLGFVLVSNAPEDHNADESPSSPTPQS